jgi:VWFA-related protein
VQQLSTDREESRRLIRRFRGQAGFAIAWEVHMRARTALQVLRSVAETLGSDAVERRAVVVISQGHALFAENRSNLSYDAYQVRADYHDVLREASLANVAIYGIDPRGLVAGGPRMAGGTAWRAPTPYGPGVGEERASVAAAAGTGAGVADAMAARYYGSLGLLAMNTGGTLTVDTNDLGKRIPGIMQDSRRYYRLAYVQPELDQGKSRSEPRRIEVKVDRPRVEIRARQRYLPKEVKK